MLDLVTQRVFGTGRPLVRRADVVVVGGANTDLTVAAATLPRPGETVAEGALHTGFGGKGANQAVAARRAGAEVAFVARMGDDEHASAISITCAPRESIPARSAAIPARHPVWH